MSLGKGQMLGIGAIALVVGMAAWLLYPRPTSSLSPVTPPATKIEPQPAPAPNTEVLPSTPSSLSLLGSVQSEAQSTLSVRLPGRIVAVSVREGDTVHAGQTLLTLDDTDVRGQVRQADAAVTTARTQVERAEKGRTAQRVKADSEVLSARAAWQQAQGRAKQAVAAVDAAQSEQQADVRLAQEGIRKAEEGVTQANQTLASLVELSKIGGVSRNDLDGARRQVKIAESDRAAARTQLQRAEVVDAATGEPLRVAVARRDLLAAQQAVQQAADGLTLAERGRKETLAVADSDVNSAKAGLAQAQAGTTTAHTGYAQNRLVSAIDGVATAVTARTGETAQPGTPLVTVVSLAGLRVDALVPARQLALLHPGLAAKVSVDTDPTHPLPATVSEIARVAEPDGRTFRVRFRLSQTAALHPGQSARITIPLHP